MRIFAIVAALLFLTLGMCVPSFVTADDSVASPEKTDDMQSMRRIIEEQQKALQELRDEVEGLKDQIGSPLPEGAAGETEKLPQGQGKGKSFQSVGAADPEEWPGFYRVPGTNTRYKVSGFAELDVIHDTKEILTPTAFVTQAIPTRGKGTDDGQTSFSVQATRIAIETRTPLTGYTDKDPRRVTTFVAADFFNNIGNSTPDLRLREAYGEVTDFLHSGGDLLLGQTWSTYTNLYAIPSTLEFWAPNAIFGGRNPAVRWTMPVGDGLKLKLAAESGNLRNFETDDFGQIDSSDATISVQSRQRWPDGVVALECERDSIHMTGGFAARDLRARTDEGHVESAFGWATTLGGRIGMPDILKDDFFQFQTTYGEGIGSLFNDYPPDAVYDVANDDLKALETLGWLIGYQHWWNHQFYSLATYGWLKQDNEDVQLPTAYKKTQYTSMNLTWTPDPRWLLGAEVVYGSREDKDGDSGSNLRTVITSRFNF